tara:strand:- start:1761 stop:1955 length:195 start_codon:yes stop_codon:yes gene_type:complete
MTQDKETLYVIHYVDQEEGQRYFEGITNNFDAWLKRHNEIRVEEGSSEEDADCFETNIVEIVYF